MMRRCVCLLIAGLVVLSGQAMAQDSYPSRPIKWIVPFPPGGPTDTLSRILAAKLGDTWKAGASSSRTRAGRLARSAPTSRPSRRPTATPSSSARRAPTGSNKIFYPNLPYDPVTDFEPITLLGTACMALVAAPNVPANKAKELVEWVRKQDGGVSYASAAPGSWQHVAAELMVRRADMKATLVPYRGSSGAMPDLMRGRLAFMFDNLPSALPAARAGKVKALAQTCEMRSPSAADLPTMVEAGFPDFVVEGWSGIFAPAKTPKADGRQALGRHQQGAEGSRLAREVEVAGVRSDRHAGGEVRRGTEGRPRLLEEDDRVHRHQGGVRSHGV